MSTFNFTFQFLDEERHNDFSNTNVDAIKNDVNQMKIQHSCKIIPSDADNEDIKTHYPMKILINNVPRFLIKHVNFPIEKSDIVPGVYEGTVHIFVLKKMV